MRLAIVTPDYAGVTQFAGGIGTLYSTLAPALSARGEEVHVVAPSVEQARRFDRDGVSVHLVEVANGVRRTPSFARESARVLGSDSFDVVLASEYGAGAAEYARRRSSGPLVSHLHTSIAQVSKLSKWPLARRLQPAILIQRRLERQQAERSDALIASTQRILRWTRELWNVGSLPSSVLPNPVPVDDLRALIAGPLPDGFPAGASVVAFSGRLETRKGVHILAEAMRTVWEDYPDVQMVVMGPDDGHGRGWMSDHLRHIVGPRQSSLHILGLQPRERLVPALAAADVVALPSLWENYSLAALEALALNSALVVTSGNGFEEFVDAGTDALVVPPGEPVALAAALARLLGDAALRERLGQAAGRVADAHRPAAVADRYITELTNIAGGSSLAGR